MSRLSNWLGNNKSVKNALSGIAGAIPVVGGVVSGAINGMKANKKKRKDKRASKKVKVLIQ